MVLFQSLHNPIINKVSMTNEEFRKCVYSQYTCGLGSGFRSPERCYEILNEREVVKSQKDYSTYNHYYKIKW